jgi:hypothetical protein
MEHNMNPKNKAVIALVSLSLAFGAATSASANNWRAHHPRRVEVNARLANQNGRIHQERKEGELTVAQAKDLHAEDRGIRADERFDASKDGSHITKAEDRSLNQQENAVSQQIGR